MAPKPLQERVNLVSIDMTNASIGTRLRPHSLPEDPPPLAIEVQTEVESEGEAVTCVVVFTVTSTEERSPEDEPVLLVFAKYRLTYVVSGQPATHKQAIDLANLSAVFNAWPFFREFACSMYSRMNLPLPPVPSLSPNHAEVFRH